MDNHLLYSLGDPLVRHLFLSKFPTADFVLHNEDLLRIAIVVIPYVYTVYTVYLVELRGFFCIALGSQSPSTL